MKPTDFFLSEISSFFAAKTPLLLPGLFCAEALNPTPPGETSGGRCVESPIWYGHKKAKLAH